MHKNFIESWKLWLNFDQNISVWKYVRLVWYEHDISIWKDDKSTKQKKDAEKVRVDDDVIKWIELKANILNINLATVINIWTALPKRFIP